MKTTTDDIRYTFKYLCLILSAVIYGVLALVPMDENRLSQLLFWAIGLLVAGLVLWYYYRETKIPLINKVFSWLFIIIWAAILGWWLV